MPEFVIAERLYNLPRQIALLDANVLIALADTRDRLHESVVIAFDLAPYSWIAPHSSVLEAWNRLRR